MADQNEDKKVGSTADKTEKKSKDSSSSPALKRSWFQGLKVEFKKITWPDKKRVAKETAVVVISAIILALVTLGVDIGLESGLQYLWS